MLAAAINGPGGAWISGTKPAGRWVIVWGINSVASAEMESTSAERILECLDRSIGQLQNAQRWIANLMSSRIMLEAMLERKAAEPKKVLIGPGSVDFAMTGSVDPILDQIQSSVDRMIAAQLRIVPPQPFDKDALLKVIEKAKTYDSKPRWMVAVESRDVFMAAYGDKLNWPEISQPWEAGQVRGSNGSLLGVKVIVDPEIKGWEFRDEQTGDKIPFVDNPATGDRYYFNDPEMFRFYTGKGGERHGEAVTGSDGVGNEAEDSPGAG
jgi:hypothetical protein